MAKFTDFFKFITPNQQTTEIQNQQGVDGQYASYGNYTWYQRLVQGSATRLTRYREYDLMDNDVEVARALDTIAEEMTTMNDKTELPFEIEIQGEDGQGTLSDIEVMTLRTAVRHWGTIHDWENRLFKIARNTIKFGDCFFRRLDNYKKWEWIPPSNVLAAVVDVHDVTQVVGYQVRTDTKTPKAPGGITAVSQSQQHSTEYLAADQVIRFSLNDDMSDSAPFGESVLRPVYRTHKQKELLEDAILIYRIQRAPERRVFYIDVGKMPPQRVKQYLETIKNEIRQKKIPSVGGGYGGDQMESVYNPTGMMEDYYFACLGLNTKISLLDGRELTLKEIMTEYEQGIEHWTYSIDQKTHKLVPGKVLWAGITRKNAELVRVHLDNGEYLDVTPDHKFVLRDGTECEAGLLQPNTSLMPLYRKKAKTNKNQKDFAYERVLDNATGKYVFTHLAINPKQDKENVIHHIDYNSRNNSPTNLLEMTYEEHWKRHHSPNGHTFGKLWREDREKMLNGIRKYHDNLSNEQKQIMADRNRKNGSKTFELHSEKMLETLQKNREQFRASFESEDQWKDYLKSLAIKQWTPEKRAIRSKHTINFNKETKAYHINDDMWQGFVHVSNNGISSMPTLKATLSKDTAFVNAFKALNPTHSPEKISDKFVYKLCNYGGYSSYKDFKETHFTNHKIVKVEVLDYKEDTGCLYVVDPGENHNFALSAGVYVKNSRPDGRGSKIETLPGGEGLGEITDLDYFMDKVFRGLRVPVSWMRYGRGNDAPFTDGKVGTAYIEELRFALFVERLQGYVERVIDDEFKRYLRGANISIDPTLYKLRLPEPTNFGKYRQQELDSALLNMLATADSVPYLAKRFILTRFLQLTDDEVVTNEFLLRQEKGLDKSCADKDLPELYRMEEQGLAIGGGGMGGGGMGGGGMGGLPPAPGEMPPPGEEGAAPGEEGAAPGPGGNAPPLPK